MLRCTSPWQSWPSGHFSRWLEGIIIRTTNNFFFKMSFLNILWIHHDPIDSSDTSSNKSSCYISHHKISIFEFKISGDHDTFLEILSFEIRISMFRYEYISIIIIIIINLKKYFMDNLWKKLIYFYLRKAQKL